MAVCAALADERRVPKLVIELQVAQVYLHCAKAFMRSKLWDAAHHIDRSSLPTIGEMLRDQIGVTGPLESQADMVARYQADL